MNSSLPEMIEESLIAMICALYILIISEMDKTLCVKKIQKLKCFVPFRGIIFLKLQPSPSNLTSILRGWKNWQSSEENPSIAKI